MTRPLINAVQASRLKFWFETKYPYEATDRDMISAAINAATADSDKTLAVSIDTD